MREFVKQIIKLLNFILYTLRPHNIIHVSFDSKSLYGPTCHHL